MYFKHVQRPNFNIEMKKPWQEKTRDYDQFASRFTWMGEGRAKSCSLILSRMSGNSWNASAKVSTGCRMGEVSSGV
jgi:hypothetical protein